jgi:ATP-dependent exoDNAse (exonuclease V) alpha subunit
MLNARFAGTCQCGARFAAGAAIEYDRASRRATACPSCSGHLASTPGSVETHTLDVRLEREVFRSDTFAVFRAGFVGAAPADAPAAAARGFGLKYAGGTTAGVGDIVHVEGTWVQDPKYGLQFQATSCVAAVIATDEALVRFLERFPQVGPRRAQEIVQRFGGVALTLKVIDEAPEKLAEVAGITPERAQAIHMAFIEQAGLREVLIYLAGLKLTPRAQAWCVEHWGKDAALFIEEDPYALMEVPGVGFARADEVAMARGLEASDPRRLAAMVRDLLDEAERDGHTWSSIDDLLDIAQRRSRRSA